MITSIASVIVNWNNADDTIICIRSLLAAGLSQDEIFVVDNSSSDKSVEKIRLSYPYIQLIINNVNAGFGGGCNLGIQSAIERGYDGILFLNNDATIEPNAIKHLTNEINSDDAVAVVGGVVYDAQPPHRLQCYGGGRVSLLWGTSRHCRFEETPDFISGAFMLIRVCAIQEVGFFDSERYFMYWEDTDLCFRLRGSGWKISVARGAISWHRESTSLGKSSPRLMYLNCMSAIKFLTAHAPNPKFAIFLMLSTRLIKSLVYQRFSRFGAITSAARDSWPFGK